MRSPSCEKVNHLGLGFYLVQLPLFVFLAILFCCARSLIGILSFGFWRGISHQLRQRILSLCVRGIDKAALHDFHELDQGRLHSFRVHSSKQGRHSAIVRGRPIYLTRPSESQRKCSLVAFVLNDKLDYCRDHGPGDHRTLGSAYSNEGDRVH